jgi:hypothetical protein
VISRSAARLPGSARLLASQVSRKRSSPVMMKPRWLVSVSISSFLTSRAWVISCWLCSAVLLARFASCIASSRKTNVTAMMTASTDVAASSRPVSPVRILGPLNLSTAGRTSAAGGP